MSADQQESFGAWLRREMQARGYDLEAPRAGGRTLLARESGVSLSIISRILSEGRIPEIDTLRRIGRVFGYSLGEMMIFAEVAERDEMVARSGSATLSASSGLAIVAEVLHEPPGDVPKDVRTRWSELSDAERYLWRTPGADLALRRGLVDILRAYERTFSGGRPGSSQESRRSM